MWVGSFKEGNPDPRKKRGKGGTTGQPSLLQLRLKLAQDVAPLEWCTMHGHPNQCDKLLILHGEDRLVGHKVYIQISLAFHLVA